MASQGLRDKTEKGRSGQREARNDATMLAACPRAPALVPAGLPAPHLRALTLMSKAGSGKVRESLTLALRLITAPTALRTSTSTRAACCCSPQHMSSCPYASVAIPNPTTSILAVSKQLPCLDTSGRITLHARHYSYDRLREPDDELNRAAILHRLTEPGPRSGVAKICHQCQASSLACRELVRILQCVETSGRTGNGQLSQLTPSDRRRPPVPARLHDTALATRSISPGQSKASAVVS